MFRSILCAVAEIFIVAWWFMLLCGALHAQVSFAIYPISYLASLGISICITGLVGSLYFWNLAASNKGLDFLLN